MATQNTPLDEVHAELERARDYIRRVPRDESCQHARDSWAPTIKHAPGGSTIQRRVDWHPVCDVQENEKELIVHAELPGVEKDRVKLEVTNDIMTLSGERSLKKKPESRTHTYHCSERSAGSFSRAIVLPGGVDHSTIAATYKDGVLEVIVPKSPKHPIATTQISIN
jgi:HSP20 family protein